MSDPANPTYAEDYDTNDYTYGVAVAGDYAYVADGGGGLVVVDVSNLANLRWIASYDTSGYTYDVAVAGGYAYIVYGVDGLVVVDVSSNPASPTRRGNYDIYGYAKGVVVAGGYAYIAYGVDGLVVLGPDTDDDGVADVRDLFPSDPDEWADGDGDGVGDNGDYFPSNPFEWVDTDGDGRGDNGDSFPSDPEEWVDSDGDGAGDNGDPMPDNALLNAWWHVGLILLIVFGAVAAASFQYGQYTIGWEVSGKLDELRAKIAEFKEKGINTNELERVLAECEAEMGSEE